MRVPGCGFRDGRVSGGRLQAGCVLRVAPSPCTRGEGGGEGSGDEGARLRVRGCVAHAGVGRHGVRPVRTFAGVYGRAPLPAHVSASEISLLTQSPSPSSLPPSHASAAEVPLLASRSGRRRKSGGPARGPARTDPRGRPCPPTPLPRRSRCPPADQDAAARAVGRHGVRPVHPTRAHVRAGAPARPPFCSGGLPAGPASIATRHRASSAPIATRPPIRPRMCVALLGAHLSAPGALVRAGNWDRRIGKEDP